MTGNYLRMNREKMMGLDEAQLAQRLGVTVEVYKSWEALGDREIGEGERGGLLGKAMAQVEFEYDFERNGIEVAERMLETAKEFARWEREKTLRNERWGD
ncbi:MAG: hypothetical protein L0220_14145 [Acidobacteria bacterium]|nr:hypothetical protein [Acidobacteriota bacterium]